jgi:hypothetical protein
MAVVYRARHKKLNRPVALNRLNSTVPRDKVLKVWDAGTGLELLTVKGLPDRVRAVAYSPDGSRLVSGSRDDTLKLWEADTGRMLLTLDGHAGDVHAVAYSPDGTCIASGGKDGTLKLWDTRTGLELLTLKGHDLNVIGVAFSPDGSRIASVSFDDTLRLWEAPTERDLRYFKGLLSPVKHVALSQNGQRVYGQDESGKILAWEVSTGRHVSDAPGPMPLGRDRTASLGNLRAEAFGNLVRLERILTPQEREERQREQAQIEAANRTHRDREYHDAEADRTRLIDPFACAFHLGRLLALSPDERPALLKRRAADLSAALKANANDIHSARSLARQVVAAPESVPEVKSLLTLLRHQPHSPLDRLHGALLLRAGNARDAAIVLRAALRNRAPSQPPLDELLLCHALLQLDRLDEARRCLKTAAEWMDHGTAPQRAASLLSVSTGGPLAALAPVAHVPDVRLNPLDPFTAHELYTLRRDAERLLHRPEPNARK